MSTEGGNPPEIWNTISGSGPPLVLCHGGPGLWDGLASLAETVADLVQVLRWDQRGGGRSERRGPYTIARFVDDLDGLRRRLGWDRWIVGGHSWGARLALEYALAHPERCSALVYLSGTGIEWARWSEAYHAEADARRTPAENERRSALGGRERTPSEEREFLALSWRTDFAVPSDGARRVHALLEDAYDVNYACNRALNAEVRSRDGDAMVGRCRGLSLPALVVHGAQDPRPVQALHTLVASLPQVECAIVEGAGHYPWLERPEPFRRALRGFLRGLPGVE